MILNGTPWFDLYTYDYYPSELTEFETINPIRIEVGEDNKIHRGDDLVLHYRNFIFEMDSINLEEQKIIAKDLFDRKLINRVVFSGGKSLHLRVSVDEQSEPTNKEEYEFLRKIIKTEYLKLENDDPAVKDPSRLTRYPNGTRYARDAKGFYVYTIPGQHKIYKKQTLLYQNDIELSIDWRTRWDAEIYDRRIREEEFNKIAKTYTGEFNIERYCKYSKNENVRKLYENSFSEGERHNGTMSAIGSLKKIGCPKEIIADLIRKVRLGSEVERKNFLKNL
jgi:hypothetical protein